MIGKTIGQYKITGKLGSGGMGEVWLAEDTRLKRRVALKFLPAEAATEDEQARFIREAQAASALDHPNICTIHEVDETDDGRTFIAMAFCDGKTVKEKIALGPLELEEVLDISVQVGEGLSRAHREGIVHRDIKPANAILTSDGTVKIVDFGLAKLTGSTQLTKTGTSMGTAAYMSPEQIRGEEVDNRTDIWALGVMLYEMITGVLPFKGENETALSYAILNDEPKNVLAVRDDIPHQIESVIGKALVKDPANRYQDIREMVDEIRNLPSGETGQPEWEKSIVVLPFANLSPDPENEYFCDGLTEEVIADLSGIRALRVISRNSAMQLKGTTKDTKTIGRELGVQFVLEGSVRKTGDDLRITGQLIDARNDAHLWAGKYSGTLEDVFDIQENVSRSIVDALKIKLSPDEKQKIEERPIDDAQAYDLHVRAQYEIMSESEEGLERALQIIQRGLEIIGENEVLYGDMGHVYMQYIDLGARRDETLYERAEECAEKVFSLNPDSPHGHFLKGFLNWRRGRIQEGALEYKRALSIDPHHVPSLFRLAWLYAHSGKPFAARPLTTRHLEIDPLSPASYVMAGAVELMDGQFDAAIDSVKKVYEMEPLNPYFRFSYAYVLAYSYRLEEACELLKKVGKEAPETHWAALGMFFVHALRGEKAKALEWVTEEIRSAMKEDEIFAIWMADCYSLLDEREEAIDWIEDGVRWGFINYSFLHEHDPFLENIRGEERFKKLMERIKHEWENFEV